MREAEESGASQGRIGGNDASAIGKGRAKGAEERGADKRNLQFTRNSLKGKWVQPGKEARAGARADPPAAGYIAAHHLFRSFA